MDLKEAASREVSEHMPRLERNSFKQFRKDLQERFDHERLVDELDNELERLHGALAASMPVRTGLLKGSGKRWSTHDRDGWEGTIEFGSGVEYAVYVLNRKPNEFDALVEAWEPKFRDILE